MLQYPPDRQIPTEPSDKHLHLLAQQSGRKLLLLLTVGVAAACGDASTRHYYIMSAYIRELNPRTLRVDPSEGTHRFTCMLQTLVRSSPSISYLEPIAIGVANENAIHTTSIGNPRFKAEE